MIRHIALAAVVALSLSAVACAAPTESPSTGAAEDSQDLVSRSAHFETFVGSDGQHYFHFLAANGANLLRSEGYETAASAEAGIASVLANGADENNVDVRDASNGTFYFNVKAGNGEVVATSGFYARKDSAERGSRAVRALVRIAHSEALTMQTGPTTAALAREAFEVFQGEDGQTYFRLRAGNGEILLESEGYTSMTGAKRGVASVKANGTDVAHYEVFATADATWGVSLRAANGEIVATGETYASKSNATRAITRIAADLGEDLATN